LFSSKRTISAIIAGDDFGIYDQRRQAAAICEFGLGNQSEYGEYRQCWQISETLFNGFEFDAHTKFTFDGEFNECNFFKSPFCVQLVAPMLALYSHPSAPVVS
jgi:hypothetical protein